MRVLAVDDEKRYRDYLSDALQAEGFEVATAGNGREAIELGISFHPDILVVDWMLRDEIHGLHVSNALQTVDPSVRTILVTGFPSSDLQNEARFTKVFDYIEKPFRLQDLIETVKDAGEAPVSERGSVAPLVVTGPGGSIVHVNSAAEELLRDVGIDHETDKLHALFPDGEVGLQEADESWVSVEPESGERLWVRSRRYAEGRLTVLLPEEDEERREETTIRLLLELDHPERVKWPFEGRVLVVDDNWIIRTLLDKQLEQIGCTSYQAESPELALKLFRADPHIDTVVLELDLPDADLQALAQELRELRPGVKLVGSSAGSHADTFARMGVERFLRKPWNPEELIRVLRPHSD